MYPHAVLLADIFTKRLCPILFENLRNDLAVFKLSRAQVRRELLREREGVKRRAELSMNIL